jgi:G8 domain
VRRLTLLALAIHFGFLASALADNPKLEVIRSAGDGAWSLPATWEGGKVPAAGSNVLIRTAHHVVYDVSSDVAIRSVHVSGRLSFDRSRDTKLVVGLIKVQPGEIVSDEGFDCDAHAPDPVSAGQMPVLEIGSADQPIPDGKTALIRLVAFEGTDKDSWPAIVCCGGRMDIHGAPMSRTWVKLGANAKKGDAEATVAEKVEGWRVGNKVIVTGTKDPDEHINGFSTEERTIAKIDGERITFDQPLSFDHAGTGEFRGEIANLSRNVVIESADPVKSRGHTMYHRNSASSLSYAEFRHLGKQGVLGRYSIHFHLAGNTMRGSSVVGVSVWDSGNRWITVHGTNYLVVRDCVGYKSIGHGFFLEDGTEVFNVLDRNLAVHAMRGKRLPKQALPFDGNEGAGYWWANSLNTFTRNVSCENERYGFRFEAIKSSGFNPTLHVMQPDGSTKPTDIRTLPFVRFEDNETHGEGLYGFNLGEGVNRVGPDDKHPFIIRNMKIWELHYGFRPQSPNVLVENMTIQSAYGVYHPNYDNHVYRNLRILRTNTEPFNRGHDDDSVQYGRLTVDGLTFDNIRSGGMPLIQISDDNPAGAADSHFRNLTTVNWNDKQKSRAVVNLGGGPRPQPKTEKGVPIYLHDYYGPGRHAMIVSTRSPEFKAAPDQFHSEPPLTGDESRVAEVKDIPFPELLHPVDDLPPATVITQIVRQADGKLLVRGTSSDNGTIVRVLVNGQDAKSRAANFSEWEALIAEAATVCVHAQDEAGNVEKLKHEMKIK